MIPNGKFIISLDFELTWGVIGAKDLVQYQPNLEGVQRVIPELLNMFRLYEVHATFSTVGFLFFKNKDELLKNIPAKQPMYERKDLRQYGEYMNNMADDAKTRLLHFAPHLIELIKQTPGQEIGSHTFSHYYCLEAGQTIDEFIADLEAAQKNAERNSLKLESLVFPKNQYNEKYVEAAAAHGIKVYRGNPPSSYHQLRSLENENYVRKAQRLADAFLNISGHNCYTDEFISRSYPYNIPASRLLRPYSPLLKILDGLKLKRIKSGMLHAAKSGETYHLWWHPHNFGVNQKENFAFLKKILSYYQELQHNYGFKSYSMIGLVEAFEKQKRP